MHHRKWSRLNQEQQLAVLIAEHQRNNLEDLHAKGILPQDGMKEINTVLRDSAYFVLRAVLNPSLPNSGEALAWLQLMAPDYWEPPKIPRKEARFLKATTSKHTQARKSRRNADTAKGGVSTTPRKTGLGIERPSRRPGSGTHPFFAPCS